MTVHRDMRPMPRVRAVWEFLAAAIAREAATLDPA